MEVEAIISVKNYVDFRDKLYLQAWFPIRVNKKKTKKKFVDLETMKHTFSHTSEHTLGAAVSTYVHRSSKNTFKNAYQYLANLLKRFLTQDVCMNFFIQKAFLLLNMLIKKPQLFFHCS